LGIFFFWVNYRYCGYNLDKNLELNLNGQAVAKHLENFIENNNLEWFGVATIRRDCKIGYSHAFRVLQLGIKKGVFENEESETFKYKMVRDDEH